VELAHRRALFGEKRQFREEQPTAACLGCVKGNGHKHDITVSRYTLCILFGLQSRGKSWEIIINSFNRIRGAHFRRLRHSMEALCNKVSSGDNPRDLIL